MEITRIANAMKAMGEKVFSLSIGDTHFAPPATVSARLNKATELGQTHYTEANGLAELRQTISDYYEGVYAREDILVTPGVKQALYYFFVAAAFQKVCVVEPAWLGYEAIAVLAQKEYLPINSKEPDWLDRLERADFDALLLCAPNNPDGKIFSASEVKRIQAVVEVRGALLLIDEIYKVYNYTPEQEHHVKALYGKEYVTVFNGLSKSHAMTGLRVGFMATKDQHILKHCANLHQNIATCTNSSGQFAAIALQTAMPEVAQFVKYYQENCRLVTHVIPKFGKYKPDGGFYYFINLEEWGIRDAGLFCKRLLEKEKVALVPGDAYGKGFESWVRLSFSIDRSLLEEALHRLKNFLEHYHHDQPV